MENLIAKYREDIRRTDTAFVRYLDEEIEWGARLIAILGGRGVGKSTLLLQHIKMNNDLEKTLYVSADDLYFTKHSLVELAEQFSRFGGKHLYIDEIHKYTNWSVEIKNIYDRIPDLQVVYTGSSILELEKGGADLSRRKLEYWLPGLSFREFLALGYGIIMPRVTVDEIVRHAVEFPADIRPLQYFKEYLQVGYFPFFKEPGYQSRLKSVIDMTLEIDIPQFAQYTVSTARKLRMLLYIIAQSVPFKPNMSKIASEVGLNRNELSDVFVYMEKAGLLSQLRNSTLGIRLLGKVEKVFLSNTNFAYALSESTPNIGNIRETFFMSLTSVKYPTTISPVSDFMIGPYTFEVGGKKKGTRQIEGVEDAFIVKDDIETGALNTVPLWHFGLLF